MTKISIIDSDQNVKRVITFNEGTRLADILPVIFKSPEISRSGNIVWIDSGKKACRIINKTIIRPFMAPLKIINTNFSCNLSDILSDILIHNRLVVVTNNNERYRIQYEKNSSAQESSGSYSYAVEDGVRDNEEANNSFFVEPIDIHMSSNEETLLSSC